jgi:hypothetical protein
MLLSVPIKEDFAALANQCGCCAAAPKVTDVIAARLGLESTGHNLHHDWVGFDDLDDDVGQCVGCQHRRSCLTRTTTPNVGAGGDERTCRLTDTLMTTRDSVPPQPRMTIRSSCPTGLGFDQQPRSRRRNEVSRRQFGCRRA